MRFLVLGTIQTPTMILEPKQVGSLPERPYAGQLVEKTSTEPGFFLFVPGELGWIEVQERDIGISEDEVGGKDQFDTLADIWEKNIARTVA